MAAFTLLLCCGGDCKQNSALQRYCWSSSRLRSRSIAREICLHRVMTRRQKNVSQAEYEEELVGTSTHRAGVGRSFSGEERSAPGSSRRNSFILSGENHCCKKSSSSS